MVAPAPGRGPLRGKRTAKRLAYMCRRGIGVGRCRRAGRPGAIWPRRGRFSRRSAMMARAHNSCMPVSLLRERSLRDLLARQGRAERGASYPVSRSGYAAHPRLVRNPDRASDVITILDTVDVASRHESPGFPLQTGDRAIFAIPVNSAGHCTCQALTIQLCMMFMAEG